MGRFLMATLLVALLPVSARGDSKTPPVVLELFTSEGCSSCPPADALLIEIGASEQWRHRIIPLSFHVDYWDDLGWKDPFASRAYTKRQRAYAGAWSEHRVYTPQMVINGRAGVVGSRRTQVLDALKEAASKTSTTRVHIRGVRTTKKGAEVDYEVSGVPGNSTWRLVAVVYQTGLSSEVTRGENAGRTLAHEYVVRHMKSVAKVRGNNKGAVTRGTARLKLPDNVPAKSLGVALLLQHARSLAIDAAARGSLP